jgi:DNA adenine methylase
MTGAGSLTVPQPFPYQGSKRKLAMLVLEKLGLGTASRLVEPFAGSAAVSLRASAIHPDLQLWVNDTNGPLIALWRAIIETPERLADEYNHRWEAQHGDPQAFYRHVRSRFNETSEPSDFMFLLSRSMKGSIRYNQSGDFNQSPDNRRLGAKPATVRQRLGRVSALLKGRTTLTSYGYTSMLSRYEPGQVWFLDPPYEGVQREGSKRYIGGVAASRSLDSSKNSQTPASHLHSPTTDGQATESSVPRYQRLSGSTRQSWTQGRRRPRRY